MSSHLRGVGTWQLKKVMRWRMEVERSVDGGNRRTRFKMITTSVWGMFWVYKTAFLLGLKFSNLGLL